MVKLSMSAIQRELSTDAGIFVLNTYQTMQKAGLDSASIFSSVGMFSIPTDKKLRFTNQVSDSFWATAELSSGDRNIGLHIGEAMPILRGHIIEYLFLSSATFGDGLDIALQYSRLLSDTITSIQLKTLLSTASLYGFQHTSRHFSEFALLQIVQFLQYITDGAFQAKEIQLAYAQQTDKDEYERIFGCPIQFDYSETAILFDAALLSWQSPSADSDLLATHEEIATRSLAELERYHLIFKINSELDDLLQLGSVDLQTIAERLNKNPHTLKADLSKVGSSFSEIVSNYQQQQACLLLKQKQQSIEQIAYLTGFSELSAFSRAFKRWTGQTPTDYRQQHRHE